MMVSEVHILCMVFVWLVLFFYLCASRRGGNCPSGLSDFLLHWFIKAFVPHAASASLSYPLKLTKSLVCLNFLPSIRCFLGTYVIIRIILFVDWRNHTLFFNDCAPSTVLHSFKGSLLFHVNHNPLSAKSEPLPLHYQRQCKQSLFTMEQERPSQRNRTACLRPQICAMLKQDKITVGWA